MKFKPTKLPIELELPKLVRDKIPQIIKNNEGIDPHIDTAKNDEEYRMYLLKKLVEEAVEAQTYVSEDNLVEELADIRELMNALMKLQNITEDDLEKVRLEKNRKNGSFNNRYILKKKS